jgi:hypothetical protein
MLKVLCVSGETPKQKIRWGYASACFVSAISQAYKREVNVMADEGATGILNQVRHAIGKAFRATHGKTAADCAGCETCMSYHTDQHNGSEEMVAELAADREQWRVRAERAEAKLELLAERPNSKGPSDATEQISKLQASLDAFVRMSQF